MNSRPLDSLKGKRLADQLYGDILERIVSGDLGEGDKLPSENALCRVHSVSRPIVREALLRLQADGLVHTRQGVGSFIRRRPPQGLIQFAEPSDVAGLLRCFEVRLPLEGTAARLAAERGTRASRHAIDDALGHLESAIGGSRSAADADFDFHMAVATAAGNEFFVDILTSLHGAVNRSMEVALEITRGGLAGSCAAGVRRARGNSRRHLRPRRRSGRTGHSLSPSPRPPAHHRPRAGPLTARRSESVRNAG